jgi:Tol biopolymer transport system component/C-terminal processing protease CtpA/Prc
MSRRTRAAVLAASLVPAFVTLASSQGTNGPPVLADPGISPDGREIAFASGGDIWSVPAAGGEARLLVSHPATESRPQFSPKGDAIAFVSTRSGGGDIYVLRFGDPTPQRLTFDDGVELVDGWSRDGRWIYYSSTARDIAGMNDVFRVSATGGTPMPVTSDRYTSEFFGAPSPEGSRLAFSARGNAAGQWWRNGHSHLDQSEIWIVGLAGAATEETSREPAAETHQGPSGGPTASAVQPDTGRTARAVNPPPTYQRIVDRGAKALWPMWAADGRSLYFMSDRSGAENVWHTTLDGQAKPVTSFARGRVLWPSITLDGRTIAFERDFGIWMLDTASGRASAVPVTLRGAAASAPVERRRLTSDFTELALSPDGKKAIIAVRGDLFAVSARDGGDGERVTNTPGRDHGVAWLPDSRGVVYVSQRDGGQQLTSYDFGSRQETTLTRGAIELAGPAIAPDGQSVAFMRGRREIAVLELASKQVRVVATGEFPAAFETGRVLAWSPDSRWLAYMGRGARGFTNVSIASVAPSATDGPRPVTFLANVGSDSVAWSPDGTFLTFATGQRTEDGQVARVDLLPRTPKFREDRFRSLFEQETPGRPSTPGAPAAPPAPAPAAPDAPPGPPAPAPTAPTAPTARPAPPLAVQISFDDVRQRLSLLPVGVDVQDQSISPDGKWILLTASAARQTNLYVYSIDELAREPAVARQLTSTAGAKASAQFTPDSKEVYYLDAGRVQIATVDDRRTRGLDVTAEMDVDFLRDRAAVFDEAWTLLNDNFFDARHNGVNWAAARTSYGERVSGARTPDEMRRVISLMIGELNASHLGISAPPGGVTPTTGKLGVRFDDAEYWRTGRLRIAEILPLGPVALAREAAVGDYLVAIDGQRLEPARNLDERLQHTIGKRVSLTVSATADGASPREVAVRPVNLTTEKGLLYRHWVETNRARVASLSGGRLGYAHLPDMSAQSLEQFYVDLDADNHAKDGVVIDVRNNNGGFVNVYAIDVLARRSYFDMTLRGSAVRAPSRSILGQRALERPTILLANQHSLSDAEDFTEGYRAHKLGKVVGEPTSGWIIYTWNTPLVDGSILRLPRMRITAADGTDMEMRPRLVDIPVTRPIGEATAGRDSQIEAAVKELLAQMKR